MISLLNLVRVSFSFSLLDLLRIMWMDVTMNSKVSKTSEARVNEKFIAAKGIIEQTNLIFFLFCFGLLIKD